MRAHSLVFLAAIAPGCAPSFEMPMTASDLARLGTGPALVAYLSQPDASAAVCDPAGHGPHLHSLDEDGVSALVDGFDDGNIRPEVFRRCVARLVESPGAGTAERTFTRLGESYRALLRRSDLDEDARLVPRLAALHALYLERTSGAAPAPARMTAWTAELTRAVAEGRIGPTASRYGRELLATIALEHGQWNGAPVTEVTLDAVAAQRDEALLRRFAARLPDAGRRREAQRRVVRLHIAATAFPEVREHARDVEEIVMRSGRNPMAPDEHPPSAARLDASRLAIDRVLVRQAVPAGTAKILGAQGSVVPEVHLRGAVQIDLQGVSRPVTLCGPATKLDPTPCVDSAAVRIASPLASLGRNDELLFADNVRIVDLLPLARSSDFAVPMALAGRELLSLRFGVRFETPEDLAFTGGQDLHVGVEAHGTERVIYSVAGGGRSYVAVVERAALGAFHVVSQGRPGAWGAPGAHGMDGTAGSAGMGAMCPSSSGSSGGRGGDGTAGGPGGPGGPGEPGGDILVDVDCGERACDDLVAQLQRTILSQGGAGGAGGTGGAGGAGGSGGPGGAGASCTSIGPNGTSTFTSLPGGSPGTAGSGGMRGPDGSPGSAGPAGRVRFRPAPR